MSENENLDKELDPEILQKFWELLKPDVPIQHQPRIYKAGWNHERAEAARQRININKPWIFSTGTRTRIGKKIVSRNALKHGLYSSVFKDSNLESIELTVSSEDGELRKEINYTSNIENEDTIK